MKSAGFQTLIDQAAQALSQRSPAAVSSDDPLEGLMFMGNPHANVPISLLMDERLGHVDVMGWQMIRLLVNRDQATAFPTYRQLQRMLRPGGEYEQASTKTVARVIAILRLTRWMTLGLRSRHESTGRYLGNVYILHDESLDPAETLDIDEGYLEFVIQCTTHNTPAVAAVARRVQKELTDIGVLNRPTRLEVMQRRMAKQSQPSLESPNFPMESWVNKGQLPTFLWKIGHFPGGKSPTFLWKISPKSYSYYPVSYGKSAVRTNTNTCICNKQTSTASGEKENRPDTELIWPWELELTHEQRESVKLMFNGLPVAICQDILDETTGRLVEELITNKLGYIRNMAERSLRGKFNVTRYGRGIASQRTGRANAVAAGDVSSSPGQPRSKESRPELRQPPVPVKSGVRGQPQSREAREARENMLRLVGRKRDR
ncbi:STY4528 family pathogenicity island replication protein [Carnimonas bestiolae]|uniref:STY4528 family pathogenicity island replication protein n=1 Tax=Carnimonas bestiolae TaxID=3402172 RepID=UPI003EDC1E16